MIDLSYFPSNSKFKVKKHSLLNIITCRSRHRGHSCSLSSKHINRKSAFCFIHENGRQMSVRTPVYCARVSGALCLSIRRDCYWRVLWINRLHPTSCIPSTHWGRIFLRASLSFAPSWPRLVLFQIVSSCWLPGQQIGLCAVVQIPLRGKT